MMTRTQTEQIHDLNVGPRFEFDDMRFKYPTFVLLPGPRLGTLTYFKVL